MTLRVVATVAAVTSIVFGAAGLFVPETMASAFGVQLDGIAVAVVRLACAVYVGVGVLNWLARDVSDRAAWRAISIGNATGWGISAVVAALAILSGFGNASAWLLVALEVGFLAVWVLAYARSAAGSTPVMSPSA